jgi:hypothetical protein
MYAGVPMILAVAVTRPRGHEHHVRALEVPMDQPDPVGGGERRGNLLHDRQSLRQQPHGQTEHVGFRLRGRSPGVADEVEDQANVGMGDLTRELDLSLEALGGLAPALRVRPYVLSATRTPSSRSSASYTSPVPPRAMNLTMR